MPDTVFGRRNQIQTPQLPHMPRFPSLILNALARLAFSAMNDMIPETVQYTFRIRDRLEDRTLKAKLAENDRPSATPSLCTTPTSHVWRANPWASCSSAVHLFAP